MRLLPVLLLLLLGSASTAEAASWIERSYAGLLVDAEAVVTGQVGEVSRHRAAFRVEGVLSGDPGLVGRTLALPVVRCNESGPDGVPSYISTCLDRTYRPGERLLLLLAHDGEGLREPDVELPPMHLGEEVVEDYVSMRLSLRAHPMELLRPDIPDIVPHSELAATPLRRLSVCGVVITRQRPGTASGVIFVTLEDETGVAQGIIWPDRFEKFRRVVMSSSMVGLKGRLQKEVRLLLHLLRLGRQSVSRAGTC